MKIDRFGGYEERKLDNPERVIYSGTSHWDDLPALDDLRKSLSQALRENSGL